MSPGYRLSRRASREFDGIIHYRRQVAGDARAQKLEADLIDAFGLIASQPRSDRNDLIYPRGRIGSGSNKGIGSFTSYAVRLRR